MPVSHEFPPLSTNSHEFPAELQKAIYTSARQFLQQYPSAVTDPQSFEALEDISQQYTNAIGKMIISQALEEEDQKQPSRIKRDETFWYRAQATQKNIMTMFGRVSFERSRYRTGSRGASWVPLEDRMGLIEDHMTRRVAYLSVLQMSHCSARDANRFFTVMGGMVPSVSALQRVARSMHASYEQLPLESRTMIGSLADIAAEAVSVTVSLDGVMVPLMKGEEGTASGCWREASCGTLSFHDAQGERLHTLYLGRMPESGKVGLKEQLAREVAQLRKLRPDIKIVACADGAVDNWRFLDKLNPDTQAIDFWHACQHLRVASQYAGKPDDWFKAKRRVLRDLPDGVDRVIRALRYLCGKANSVGALKELKRELNYFHNNRKRMSYAELRGRKQAIGSGVVEAANKVLVTQRMKQSGMRWKITSGQAILTFRALDKSALYDRTWSDMMKARDAAANDNYAQPEMERAA